MVGQGTSHETMIPITAQTWTPPYPAMVHPFSGLSQALRLAAGRGSASVVRELVAVSPSSAVFFRMLYGLITNLDVYIIYFNIFHISGSPCVFQILHFEYLWTYIVYIV